MLMTGLVVVGGLVALHIAEAGVGWVAVFAFKTPLSNRGYPALAAVATVSGGYHVGNEPTVGTPRW